MIEYKNITKYYGSVPALKEVDLTLPTGAITMLLGPSGCGKSTMLKLSNRLVEPDQGTITLDGRDIREMPVESLRRNMGYAIQGIGLFPHMTVGENIGTVPRLNRWEPERIRHRVEELLDLVGLPGAYRDKYPHQLSGGEAQRVGVARALGADPDVLLMDEPFGALDPVNRKRLQREFLRIQRRLKKTVLFVTHDVNEAATLADQLVIMKDGRICGAASPETIAQSGDPDIVGFLGNGFGLELLERHPLEVSLGRFAKQAYPLDCDEILYFDRDSTMRDVFASFLLSDRKCFAVTGEPDVYGYNQEVVADMLSEGMVAP